MCGSSRIRYTSQIFHVLILASQVLPPRPHDYAGQRTVNTQQSPASLDFWLGKNRAGKSHDFRDAIVFDKLGSQNVFRPHENTKPAI